MIPSLLTCRLERVKYLFVYIETGSDGKAKRKKSMLSNLLARVEEQLGVTVSYADTSGVADARRLFVDLLRATNSHVELLAKLTGEFHPPRVEVNGHLQVDQRQAFEITVTELAKRHGIAPALVRERLLALHPFNYRGIA